MIFKRKKQTGLDQPAVLLAHPRMPEGHVIEWEEPVLKLTRKQRRQLKKMGNPKVGMVLLDQENGLIVVGRATGESVGNAAADDSSNNKQRRRAPTMEELFNSEPS